MLNKPRKLTLLQLQAMKRSSMERMQTRAHDLLQQGQLKPLPLAPGRSPPSAKNKPVKPR